MNKDNIIFILDASQMANNVAQAARAMANFGFHRLRLVNPLNLPSAERMARGGAEVVRNASVYAGLDEALADLSWVMGTTGKEDIGNEELVRPEEGAAELAGISHHSKVGIVFGCENHGLTNSQLKTMDRLAHIPTQEDCASVNLAQSVALFSWELDKLRLGPPRPLDFGLPSQGKRQQLFGKLDSILSLINVRPEGRRLALADGLRQFINRNAHNNKDVSMLLRAMNLLQKDLMARGAAPAPAGDEEVDEVAELAQER